MFKAKSPKAHADLSIGRFFELPDHSRWENTHAPCLDYCRVNFGNWVDGCQYMGGL